MKLKTLFVALFAVTLLGACVPTNEVPPTPELDIVLPISGTEEVWNSSDHAGRPVLVSVMASYCPWCKRSLPALDAANAEFGDHIEVVGIFVDEDDDSVEQVKKEHNMKSKALYQGGEVAQNLQVRGFPQTMLFNQKGKLVKVWSGYSDTLADQYKHEIEKLLE